jgi:hypothetical protein
VFEFNERAIRSYRSCGFTIEGRSREAIWRDGRWWDEITMSILEPEWRAREARRTEREDEARAPSNGRAAKPGGKAAVRPALSGQPRT